MNLSQSHEREKERKLMHYEPERTVTSTATRGMLHRPNIHASSISCSGNECYRGSTYQPQNICSADDSLRKRKVMSSSAGERMDGEERRELGDEKKWSELHARA